MKRIVAMVALFLVLLLTSCAPTTEAQAPAKPKYYGPEVEYEISGSADSVSVTLANPTGGTEQQTVYLPRTFTYYDFPGSFLYISAQNQGQYGTVRVEIKVNGQTVKTASSSGAYVIASASARK